MTTSAASVRGRSSKATPLDRQTTEQHALPNYRLQVRSNKGERSREKWTRLLNLFSLAVLTGGYYFFTVVVAPPDTSDSPRSQTESSSRNGRFPQYGTLEFSKICSWNANAHVDADSQPDCTFLVRPLPSSNEGVSAFMSEVAAAYIYGLQLDCRLLLDYGPGVDVGQVVEPVDDLSRNNWTVPHGFDNCVLSNGCFQVARPLNDMNLRQIREEIGSRRTNNGGTLPAIPASFFHYRSAYAPYRKMDLKLYQDVEGALPGFRYETGMACSLNSVFRLSPSASKFVPNLFTRILPTLRDPSSFVIALYFRTGRTDGRDNNSIDQNAINCALGLEEDHVPKGSFSRAVWMVVTDSPSLGRAIVSQYHDETTKSKGPSGTVMRREIVTTSSRGVQTKPKVKPKTADFAEAMIDWYLLGESDVVVSSGGFSFGTTAALRTARPVYFGRNDGCYKREIPIGVISNMSLVYPR